MEEKERSKIEAKNKIENRLHNLRIFLINNKIFLDVFVTLLVGFMAATLAYQANQIAEKQTTIMEIQAMPQFTLSSMQVETLNGGQYGIIVNNDGSPVRGLTYNLAVFLSIGTKNKKISIPIDGFYGEDDFTNNGKGKILTIYGTESEEMYSNIEKEMGQLIKSMNQPTTFRILQYARLNYMDVLGKFHNDYFVIPLVSTGMLLTPEEGEKVFREYENGNKISLKTVTSSDLQKIINSKFLKTLHDTDFR
ncbi:hypothetical protein [Desulfosporosinus sp. BG]|uniref:hypothetical protein n=1 Tax=Desulfosporosinus sp. BG TaxID=1633135 RepID=UPI00083AB91C|nr:hypothetical protein [Desulfosporosinus sp. BG]ODA41815.1 hypothetical protein DSBG_1307 [Desulfosporosinus sp. BG]